MVFSSLLFTFIFLPLVTGLFYLSKEKYRNYVLLVASFLFYAYGEPEFVYVMLLSILINYCFALLVNRANTAGQKNQAKLCLFLDVALNLALLFVCKYLNFAISIGNALFQKELPMADITLPIGISFFTFQALSYVIDVYYERVNVQKNPLYIALYISFFPQLIAGPIVRYHSIEEQITKRVYSVNKFGEGTQRFLLGFCKKILLSNHLAVVAEGIRGMDVHTASPSLLWLGSICYSLQIFYDFSGYSDMAIGLGKIFGFEFEENFNYPYISRSVTEFWRRWHISLGQWFRDYVYIPLGGSKVCVPRHILNLLIVWLLTGIWHGANYNFVVWGLIYFCLLVLEKYAVKPEQRKSGLLRILWQAVTLLCVNFAWVIFNSLHLKDGIRYCLAMIGYYHIPFEIMNEQLLKYMREYGFFLLAGLVFATPAAKKIGSVLSRNRMSAYVADLLLPICYGIAFLWAVSFLILGAHNPFIYFNF